MKRLEKIVSYIDDNKIVADIGSDHGITAIKVYEEKSPKKVIATDISKPSLQKLVDKLEYLNYDIETIVTDGLKGLPSDIDQIIISGMGGHLITKIISGNLDLATKAEKLVLSPNNSKEYFRKWMHANGFSIISDDNVEDEGIIYDVISVKYEGEVDSYEDPFYYIYGKDNIINKNSLTIKLIQEEVEEYNNLIENLNNQESEKIINRIKELEKEIKDREDLLCRLDK